MLFSVFIRKKVTVTENITFADSMSGIRSPDYSKVVKNPKNDNDVTISRHDVNVKLMSISSLVLELCQFSFIRDWPEIQKLEIPPSDFCPISGDWGELWIPNLAWMSLIECYWMLQNSGVTAFTIFELLREIQLGGGGGGVELPQPTYPD